MRMEIYQIQVQQFFFKLTPFTHWKIIEDAYQMTLYFQSQFINFHCTVNAKSAIKCLLKNERLPRKQQRDLNLQKRKYHENPKKKTGS